MRRRVVRPRGACRHTWFGSVTAMANPKPVCSVDGCDKVSLTHKTPLCSAHYQRARVHGGDPLGGRTPVGEPLEYFRTAVLRETDDCILWPYKLTAPDKGGYGQVWIDGSHKSVHVLACEMEHGPRPDGMDAAHGPCNRPHCFNRRHVSWKTRLDNMADQERDGTRNRGERNGGAKIAEADVRAIRVAAAGGESLHSIGARYGLSHTHIGAIVRREKWRHVE